MSYLVLVVLSLLWLGFFFPSLLQSRRTSSPLGSVETFQESLTRISMGRAVTAEEVEAAARRRPRRSRREIARQRDALAVLGAAVIGSIALMLAFGGPTRWLVVLSIGALAGYVGKLRLRVLHETAPRRMPVPAPKTFPVEAGIVPSVRRRPAPDAELERLAG
jgi:hypothetical protein